MNRWAIFNRPLSADSEESDFFRQSRSADTVCAPLLRVYVVFAAPDSGAFRSVVRTRLIRISARARLDKARTT